MRKPFFLLFVAILLFLTLVVTTYAKEMEIKGKVIAVDGDMITIDLGQSYKLAKGMIGSIYYEILVGNETKSIIIGQFELTEIGELESKAHIINKTGDISVGRFIKMDIKEGVGMLYVTSEPSGATVSLDGNDIGRTELLLDKVSSGIYNISVSLKFYYTITQTIVIQSGETTKLSLSFKRGNGNLSVRTIPAEAKVQIGEKIGVSPVNFDNLPAGEYEVNINMDGYIPLKRLVEVNDNETAMLDVQLEKYATLLVEVSPGGFVSIDDGVEKIAPLQLSNVLPGNHTITTHQENYETQRLNIELKAGEKRRVSIKLESAKAKLIINTIPKGAEVVLDDIIRGKTPVTLEGVIFGSHAISLSLKDYEKIENNFIVNSPSHSIDLTLQHMQGTIKVNSSPTGAVVYVSDINKPQDRKFVQDSTPVSITLPTGNYILELQKRNYIPAFRMILLNQGENPELFVNLEKPIDTASLEGKSIINETMKMSDFPYLKRFGRERIQCSILRLNILPFDAKIYFDDKPLEDLAQDDVIVLRNGNSGLITFKNLTPGMHTILATQKNHNTIQKYVSIKPGNTKDENIRLYNRWSFHLNVVLLSAIVVGIYVLVMLK